MGITNDMFPLEPLGGISQARLRECDLVKDPEDLVDPRTGKRAIDNFEAFMKFLAPLPRGPITDEARAGEQVFNAIGCASCHVPSLTTGANASAALNRKTLALFSDLLLHDVGTGDGIEQEAAQQNEIRTPALWGLRLRRPLLHDGSAADRERCAAAAWRGSVGGDGTLSRRHRTDAPRLAGVSGFSIVRTVRTVPDVRTVRVHNVHRTRPTHCTHRTH